MIIAIFWRLSILKGRQGSSPLTDKRVQCVRLVKQGLNNVEACRVVGVNRKTGQRRRHGRKHTNRTGQSWVYAPMTSPTRSYEATTSMFFLADNNGRNLSGVMIGADLVVVHDHRPRRPTGGYSPPRAPFLATHDP